MEAPIVEQALRINSYETDLNANIKAVSMQNLLQEVAYRGSEFCHCGPSVMKGRGIFWALNRIHFHIYDYPKWEDDVRLQTWSRGQIGPLWHRNFRMYREDASDKPIMLGTSAWTVVDLKERSIYRGDLGFDSKYHYDEDTLPLCTKILVPKDLEQKHAGSHIVVWSDLDTNAHANNCAYTQWAIDAMPFEYIKSRLLRDINVNYYHEVHFGETVDLYIARDADVWYITGKAEDRICFVERLEFD